MPNEPKDGKIMIAPEVISHSLDWCADDLIAGLKENLADLEPVDIQDSQISK